MKTNKQEIFLKVIAENPGINTLELHRMVGNAFAHGVPAYTYETLHRMARNVKGFRPPLIKYGPAKSGRGQGLYLIDHVFAQEVQP